MPVFVPIKKIFDLPTEDTHPATIIGVTDKGEGDSLFGDGKRNMVTVTYRIDDQRDTDGDLIELDQHITSSITPGSSSTKQSALYKLLTVGLGIVIPKAKAFDAETIIGRSLFIKIQHKRRKNATFADVVDYPKTVARRQVATVVEDVLSIDGEEGACKTN